MILGAYSSPQRYWDGGGRFDEDGINALFLSSGRIDSELIARAREQGAETYAEFATFRGDYALEKHPDLAPIGRDGLPIPKTKRFLGACPSAPRFLAEKDAALRTLVREHPVKGVWLDYLHFHCDFELPDPPLDQSCFCDRCLQGFTRDTGVRPEGRTTAEKAEWLLAQRLDAWTDWKCGVVAEFAAEARAILDAARPGTKLGIFSCPWTDEEYGNVIAPHSGDAGDGGVRRGRVEGALRTIVAQDIDRLHAVVDVFSPMVYQAKCGRPPEWVGEYSRWLVERVAALNQRRGREVEVWPIVEAEGASPAELETILRGALEGGATGVMFFALPHVADDPAKREVVRRVYRDYSKGS